MNRRVEGIDLLRGIAIGLVMARHAWPEVFPGAGVVGVVMFFALSGYLITGLLVDELDRTGRVDLRRFYLLWPAVLVVAYARRRVRAALAGLAVLSVVPLRVTPSPTWQEVPPSPR